MNRKTTLFLLAFSLILSASATYAQDFFTRADAFFSENVRNGQVNYSYLHDHPEVLEPLIYDIGHTSLKGRSAEYKKAFYINAYNILVIHTIAAEWPVENPLNIKGMFNERKHKVSLEPLTLDQLEKERLSPDTDPRLHFALVCGAKGCPPLSTTAFIPRSVSEQLDNITRTALSKPWILSVNKDKKVITASEIMKWYLKDFGGDTEGIIRFINRYIDPPISNKYTVKYAPYDWSVNAY